MGKNQDHVMAYVFACLSGTAGTTILFYAFGLERFIGLVNISPHMVAYALNIYTFVCLTVLLAFVFLFEEVSKIRIFRSTFYYVVVGFVFPVICLSLGIVILPRAQLEFVDTDSALFFIILPVLVFVSLSFLSYLLGKYLNNREQ